MFFYPHHAHHHNTLYDLLGVLFLGIASSIQKSHLANLFPKKGKVMQFPSPFFPLSVHSAN